MEPKEVDWLRRAPDTLEYHLAHPEVPPAQHRQSKRLALAENVLAKHRIYLDTKFWIILRDTHLGRPREQSDTDLLSILRELKECGKAFCPLSYSSVHEMWLQDDFKSRLETASIMDELSDSVCLQSPDTLFQIELSYLLYSTVFPGCGNRPPRELVWTKAAFYVGEPTLSCKVLPDEAVMAMQKCIDDSMFAATIAELTRAMSKRPRRRSADLDALAADLTIGKMQNPEPSFNDLYHQEIIGGLEAHQEICGQIMERLCRATGFASQIEESEKIAGGRMLRGLIEAAITFGRIRSEFPQLHITANLHAALRWDNRRQYKRGDCEDFRHAGSALPYCNYFLTERSLKHILCTKPLKLDTEYNATVLCDSQTAVSALSELL